MAVYRVERTRDYTVMSNYHLKDGNLSLKAKGLLSVMLSLPDQWDYSTRGLASICKEGVDAIGTGLKELEKAGYIVRRQLRGDNGRIIDTEYTIYEQPQEPDKAPKADEAPKPQETPEPDENPEPAEVPDLDDPDTAEPDTVSPYTENPDVDKPDTENPAELNIKKSNTKKSITHQARTHSVFPSAEGRNEVSAMRARIMDQIEYGLITDPMNREQVNELVELMLEVALSVSPTIKIGRDQEYPTALVQERFEHITSTHIEKVLDGIRENTTRVWNTRAYLLASLFNAPSTTDNHYTMQVNHDMNGG